MRGPILLEKGRKCICGEKLLGPLAESNELYCPKCQRTFEYEGRREPEDSPTSQAADTRHENPSPCISLERPWPVALATEALHGVLGEIIDTVEPHTEADPVAILTNLLVFFGNAVGYGPHFRVEQDKHGMRLFAVQVGHTSKGRKGVADGIARAVFNMAAPDWANKITSGMSTGEGLIWGVRDAIERQDPVKEKGKVVRYETVVADEGVSDKRLLVVEPEFARILKVMGRDGNTLSAILRQAWDNGNLRVLSRTTAAVATEAHI
ncbi:MAG: hypothetical protein ABIH46_06385, partial [Chloroflexota bacterium]